MEQKVYAKPGLDQGVGHPSSRCPRLKHLTPLRTCACGDFASDAAWPHVADAVLAASLTYRSHGGMGETCR